jgi:hypothetical protein
LRGEVVALRIQVERLKQSTTESGRQSE